MKKINIYKTLLVSACAFITLGTTSCDDFLTIYPSTSNSHHVPNEAHRRHGVSQTKETIILSVIGRY